MIVNLGRPEGGPPINAGRIPFKQGRGQGPEIFTCRHVSRRKWCVCAVGLRQENVSVGTYLAMKGTPKPFHHASPRTPARILRRPNPVQRNSASRERA